jgi:hypothetical protein
MPASASRSTPAASAARGTARHPAARPGLQLQLGDAARAAAPGCARTTALLVGARSLALRSSYSLRWRPGLFTFGFSASAVCRPACAAASLNEPSSSSSCCPACRLAATCCARSRWRAAVRAAGGQRPRLERASCAWRSSARCCSRASASGARRRSPRLPARRGAPGSGPVAGPVPRSALRRWRGALPALELRVDLGQFLVQLAARASVASACCVRRSRSTCSWWARVCASAASRRAVSRRCEASV